MDKKEMEAVVRDALKQTDAEGFLVNRLVYDNQILQKGHDTLERQNTSLRSDIKSLTAQLEAEREKLAGLIVDNSRKLVISLLEALSALTDNNAVMYIAPPESPRNKPGRDIVVAEAKDGVLVNETRFRVQVEEDWATDTCQAWPIDSVKDAIKEWARLYMQWLLRK